MEVVNIIAIIISPILALLISQSLQAKHEKQSEKLQILKTLMTQRILPKSVEYVNALNTIDIIFADSKSVREAYKSLYESYHQKDFDYTKSQTKLTKLIEAIVADVGYKEKITWDTIQQPYYPIWLDNEIQTNSTIQEYNFAIATSALYGAKHFKEDIIQ